MDQLVMTVKKLTPECEIDGTLWKLDVSEYYTCCFYKKLVQHQKRSRYTHCTCVFFLHPWTSSDDHRTAVGCDSLQLLGNSYVTFYVQ